MTRLRFQRLSTRLAFWFVLVAVAPVVATSVITYHQRARVLRTDAVGRLEALRDLKVESLDQWLDERQADVLSVSQDMEIRRLDSIIAGHSPAAADDDTREAARHLLERYSANIGAFRRLDIVSADTHRIVLSSEPGRAGARFEQPEVVQNALAVGKPSFSPVVRAGPGRSPYLTVAAPIACAQHGGQHDVAVVVGAIDLEGTLFPTMARRGGMGETGEMLLVNRDVVAVTPLRFDADAALTRKISARPAVLASQGRTGVIETDDYRGVPVLAAYTFIPRTRWGFVAKRDRSELYAPIETLMWQLVILVLATAALAAAGGAILARTISRPVKRLAQVSERLASGELDARTHARGEDEVAALGRSLDRMADALALHIGVRRATSEVTVDATNAQDLRGFGERVTCAVIERTSSVLGALYVRAEDDSFERAYSVGLSPGAADRLDASEREGQLGAALLDEEVHYVTGLDERTPFVFKTVVGGLVPAELAALPVAVRGRVEAVFAFGSTEPFSDHDRGVFDHLRPTLCTLYSNLVASTRAHDLAASLQTANDELTEMNLSLQSQSGELERQAHELKRNADELERKRQQVEEADRLKSEFLSNMSHELRTPLNSIMALSQLMLSRSDGYPEEEAESLRIIERNGRHLLTLINEILDLSKIEAGRMDLRIATVSPASVVREVVEASRPLAEEKGLDLRTEVGDVAPVQTDPHRLRQVLLNLLSNAVKFTDAGHVTVKVTAGANRVSFFVRDTGIGIAREDLPWVFDEFRQVDGSTTRKYGGTGLGLAISRKLARLLGGELTVESEPKRGSTFRLDLPLAYEGTQEPVDSVPATPRLSAPPPSDRPRVLIVDDSPEVGAQLRSALLDAGYAVSMAEDGDAALEAIEQRPPDGILLDLMMPGVDGFTVLEKLRASEETARIPVLVVTAKELTAQERSRLAHNNVQQLIQKGSVDLAQLLAEVRLLVGQDWSQGPQDRPSGHPHLPEVLVVEDNADNRATLGSLLADLGVRHTFAEDGLQAVEIARSVSPHLVLMDIQLPGLSGLDATRLIRSDPALRHVRIVAVTAHAMSGDRETFLKAGCDDYLPKPIERSSLVALLEKHLRKT